MTTDCSLFMKIVSSEYLQNMLCTQIVVFVLFWHSEQFWYITCSADIASFWKKFTCIFAYLFTSYLNNFKLSLFKLRSLQVLGSCGFQWCSFHLCEFQKVANISGLRDFHYITEGISSLMRFWLLMTLVLRISSMRIFARPKKDARAKDRGFFTFIFNGDTTIVQSIS